jgi:CDP-paratose 2-epimerase
MYGLRIVINRCGVLTGPWQMGQVDQGFVALWAARHKFGGHLSYRGFGGKGHQVRDILHVSDFYELIKKQLTSLENINKTTYNVGGGSTTSVSLAELTSQCHTLSAKHLAIGSDPETSSADVPYYITDNSTVSESFDWKPERGVEVILDDIFRWLTDYRVVLGPVFGNAI